MGEKKKLIVKCNKKKHVGSKLLCPRIALEVQIAAYERRRGRREGGKKGTWRKVTRDMVHCRVNQAGMAMTAREMRLMPMAKGAWMRMPSVTRWAGPTYSSDRQSDMMKRPTAPNPDTARLATNRINDIHTIFVA